MRFDGAAGYRGNANLRARAMSYGGHHHGGGMFGLAAIVYVIAYVFGKHVAQIVVGTAFLIGAAFFAYVMFRVVMGTI
jgi:hypothetical protein